MVHALSSGTAVYTGSGASVASLTGQLRRDQAQLDDWTTCVSAKTTKGQAEIERLSGAVSAEREQIERAQAQPAGNSSSPAPEAGARGNESADAVYQADGRRLANATHSLDVWA
jgi:hypothetical protein